MNLLLKIAITPFILVTRTARPRRCPRTGCRKCDDQRMTADDTHRPLVPFADLNWRDITFRLAGSITLKGGWQAKTDIIRSDDTLKWISPSVHPVHLLSPTYICTRSAAECWYVQVCVLPAFRQAITLQRKDQINFWFDQKLCIAL